jgi:hypothetical protein
MIASEQPVTKPNAYGPATRLTMSVKAPSTTHEIQWGKVEVWLQSAGKPNEQVLKQLR